MRFLSLIAILLAFTHTTQAQKWDYQWLFGYGSNNTETPTFGLSLMDFNNGEVTIDYYGIADLVVNSQGSFICEPTSGTLDIFTNGCYIWDDQIELITTDGYLIDDYSSDTNCPYGEYPGYYSNILLPEVNNDSIYYMLQKNQIYSESHGTFVSNQLLLHYLKRHENGFILEESRVLLDTFLQLAHMTAMLNEDQDKWWVSVTGYETNRHFTFLVGGEDTTSTPVTQEIGGESGNLKWDIGQPNYSPNGLLYANSTEAYGIMLFDFDNATGEYSNYREIHYPNMDTAEGLAFSPNNRFIYVTTAEDFYQIDLEATDSIDQIYHIDHVRSADPTGWPIGLGYMILGPDCRIYISPGTTTNYMHVVHQPDEKGENCLFVENAVVTPTRFSHFFPNIPNYHYPRGCDNSIAWGFPVATDDIVEQEREVHLFPNPTSDKAFVQLYAHHEYEWLTVKTLDGKIIFNQALDIEQQNIEIDMSNWLSAAYILELRGKETPQSIRLIKQ